MPTWLVKTRRAPSRQSRDARVYGHTTTAMHKLNTPPPPPYLSHGSTLDAWCADPIKVRVGRTRLGPTVYFNGAGNSRMAALFVPQSRFCLAFFRLVLCTAIRSFVTLTLAASRGTIDTYLQRGKHLSVKTRDRSIMQLAKERIDH